MRTTFALLAVVLVSSFLSACNTVEGAGQDIQKGGQAISETANEVKNSN